MSEFQPRTDELSALYRDHLAALQEASEAALEALGHDALIIHAGSAETYFADDQEIPFRTNPYFAHFLPLRGPEHYLFLKDGAKPVVVAVTPQDFWTEHLSPGNPFWADEVDVRETATVEDAAKLLPRAKRAAFVGPESAGAKLGIEKAEINPEVLRSRLDWRRSFKTPYEIACLEEANHRAAHAHEAARSAFYAGACELEIHEAYLEELGQTENELPYSAITALNEKCATLHYQGKRLVEDGKTALIDAGASYLGYASDITRTYAADASDFLFRGLLGGVESLQQELVAMAVPGISFPELHHAAHVKIGRLLAECGILGLPGEDAAEKGLTNAFFPHGLGHFLGITVHDVGGNQKGPDGGKEESPANFPKLRMTRTIEEGMVFTVEPGVYFIPMLLKRYRTAEESKYFNWELIDRLTPSGGVRIEDDVLAIGKGNRNLTREYLP